jgi:NADPH2:quinone reductase
MRAIVVARLGGPDVLEVREVGRPEPGAGETLIEVSRAGVNFSDLWRRGVGWREPAQPLPVIPGFEVVGRRVSDGTRVVAMTTKGSGGYAEYAAMPERSTLPIPDGVSDTAALAATIQGSTAWGALVHCARLQAGDTVAVMAAAGGLGSLALQLARLHGASRVIAVASTEEKRRLALDALAYDGRMVVLGQATGASNTVSLDLLMDRSIGVCGYWVTPLHRDSDAGAEVIARLLQWIAEGRLRAVEGPEFPIGQAGAAHAAIEARATVGKVTLTVEEASWT